MNGLKSSLMKPSIVLIGICMLVLLTIHNSFHQRLYWTAKATSMVGVTSTRPVGPESPTVFNLVENPEEPEPHDKNSLLKNPAWQWQIKDNKIRAREPGDLDLPNPNDSACTNLTTEPCTTQHPSVDERGDVSSFTTCTWAGRNDRPHGHVNWFPATYEGKIAWEEYSTVGDNDYNFKLYPKFRAGLTRNNPEAFHIEFNSYETIVGFITPTWKKIRQFVTECDFGCNDAAVAAMVNNKNAIVTGLVGLDSEHQGYTELHPVYALAIEINSNPKDNVWLIFVRNWGDEGACSTQDHPLPLQNNLFKLFISKPSAQGVEVLKKKTKFASYQSAYYPTVELDDNKGATITFDLSKTHQDPGSFGAAGPVIEGEMHLSWTFSKAHGNDLTGSGPSRREPVDSRDIRLRESKRLQDRSEQATGQSPTPIEIDKEKLLLTQVRAAGLERFAAKLNKELNKELKLNRLMVPSFKNISSQGSGSSNSVPDQQGMPNAQVRESRRFIIEQRHLLTEKYRQRLLDALCKATGDHVTGFDCPTRSLH